MIITFCFAAFGQLPPVNDTLIPKQHRDDTIMYEPKLQGGALIDTVNIKDSKPKHQPGYVNDSLKQKGAVKPKNR